MNYKIILAIGAMLIVAFFIAKNFLSDVSEHGNVQSISKSIEQLQDNQVLAKIGFPKSDGEALVDGAKEEEIGQKTNREDQREITYADIQDKEARIQDIYQMEQVKMVHFLAEIAEHQKEIIKWKQENGIKITALDNTNPKFALALSVLVGKPVDEAVEVDRLEMGLSSHDWYYVKAFSESGDLEKLMRQGKLNSSYVNIENLSLVYSNKNNIVYRETGEPDLPDDSENLEEIKAAAESDNRD